MNNKIAIGCLVQWYESEMISEYVETLKEAISQYDGEVIVDVAVVLDQTLEKCTSKQTHQECKEKILNSVKSIDECKIGIINNLYTIADYRREFNDRYCDEVDVLVWGESDMLVPKQMFIILNTLHQMSTTSNPKYLAFFGTCKMWDDSWLSVEHSELTNKPRNASEWWGTRYQMSIDEMNGINDKVEELDVRIVSPHKFNGCGLVISSEVIKSGVNIPKSVFFTHEDSALMYVTNKLLGNIPQYVIKNILLVHNREHKNKRNYILGECGNTLGERRKSSSWYNSASKMSEENYKNIFNPNYKSKTWQDVWNNIK